MGLFNFYTDEDGKFVQDTEGPCQACGDWAPQRYKYYGMLVCERCYAEAEDPENYNETYMDTKEE